MTEPFVVSAPGKVILFGEHSAVYGKPAIAAALSLRAYLLVTPSADPLVVELEFPDISLSKKWKASDIPFKEAQSHTQVIQGKPQTSEELIPELVEVISALYSDVATSTHRSTCHCFLYMYSILGNANLAGMKFSVRSSLPIGAGLGLSALVSVCLAAGMAVLGGHVDRALLTIHDKSTSDNVDADFIDKWLFIGEKCFHGNPSGIDNAVATYGGAVMFQRVPGNAPIRTPMRNLPSMDLLLTNTKIPRSTADLVANVARIYGEFPLTGQCLLDGMAHLVDDAYRCMTNPEFGSLERQRLRELFNINHGFLVAYGVSHPALEKIKIIGDEHHIGATKLTGAGGGGCAITLLNDGVSTEVSLACEEFNKLGFETYETSLGGKGVGFLGYKEVDEKIRRDVFDDAVFAGYKSRQELIDALAVENITGWKFW